jgi:hypothetical protein
MIPRGTYLFTSHSQQLNTFHYFIINNTISALISSKLALHRLATGRHSRIATALTMLKQMLFKYDLVLYQPTLSITRTSLPALTFANLILIGQT